MPWFLTPHGPHFVVEPGTIDEYERRDYTAMTQQQVTDYFAGVAVPDPPSFATEAEVPGIMATVAADAGSAFSVAQRAAFGAVVNPAKHGLATTATGAANTAALTAAVAELVAAGGGILSIPAGIYDATLTIADDVPVLVMAWGVTFRAYADGQTVLAISQGVGTLIEGSSILGLNILGNGRANVIGADVYDTDGAMLTLPRVHGCAVGVRFRTVAAGEWVERCTLSASYITSCTVGIEYVKGASAMPSFNECALRDVGVSACGLGIAQRAGTDFTRVTWDNVTIWVNANQTGVLLDGQIDFARLTFGVESFSATGTVGVQVGPNYTNYADPWAHDLQISLVGSFATKVLDSSTGGFGIVYRDGRNIRMSQFGTAMFLWRGNEGNPRMAWNALGIQMGDGSAWPNDLLQWNSGSKLSWTGSFAPAKGIVPRVVTLTDAATVTPDCGATDVGKLATVSQATTIANPTGTKVDGQQMTLRIKSAAVQTLTWGAQYRAGAAPALPTATTGGGKTDYLTFVWNSADSKWDLIVASLGH